MSEKLRLAKLMYFCAMYRLLVDEFMLSEKQARHEAQEQTNFLNEKNVDYNMMCLNLFWDGSLKVWEKCYLEYRNEETRHDYR